MYCSSKCVTAKYIVILLVQRDPEVRLLGLFETSGISHPMTQCNIPEDYTAVPIRAQDLIF